MAAPPKVTESAQPDAKVGHEYQRTRYYQFYPTWKVRLFRGMCAILVWPVVVPLALLCRKSEMLFRTASEALSLIPYVVGVIVRGEFYRFALQSCGSNVVVEFGAVFIYPCVSLGNNVLIGHYSVIHHCDIGDYVLIGERCTFLSGCRQHTFDRTDVPIALQGGWKKRISIGNDCWVGSHSIVMESVAGGSIVGAGSVVTKPVSPYAIVAGNPARIIRQRHALEEARFSPSAESSENSARAVDTASV